MRVLAFTTVFPNSAAPQHGLFVLERLRYCARLAELRVIAPYPFWPLRRKGVSSQDICAGLSVEHPVFRYVPRFGKWLDGTFLYFSALPTVRRLAREQDFDLIDAHFGYPDGFAAVLLGRALGKPVVITLRGTEPLVAAAGPWRRAAMRFALRRATRLIAVSTPLAEFARDMVADAPSGAPPSVTVIANGVDLKRFVPARAEVARAELGLPPEGRLIVSVGHLSPRKGFQRVLRTLPELLRDAPDLHFAVIGGSGAEGSNETELRRLAAAPELAGRVTFAGSEPPERVARWLQAADLFVLASDYEGCPNVVWEALACGLPVVAARVGEIPRMVPAFAGHLIDDADDLLALRAALAAGLAGGHDRSAIRAWAERHDWGAVAARVHEEWTAALAAAAPPGVAGEGIAAL